MAFAPAGPAIDLMVDAKIPARVVSGPGIDQSLDGGVLTTSLDFTTLADNAGISDPSQFSTVIFNTVTEEYEEVSLDAIPTTTTGDVRTPRGDADYIILAADRYVALTATLTAPRTWTLPAASTVTGGIRIVLQDEAGGISSTNTLTVGVTGGDTINGASTWVISTARSGVEFRSDGASKWSVRLVGSGDIAANAVTTAKILDANVTTAKIADANVTTAKIAAAAVTPALLAAAAKAFLIPANVGVSASVAASALTITLTDAAGSTPSATSPCIIPFRSATAATGTITTVEVSSAASLVISSGSTLGTANGGAFNLYLVGFNDGGTFRLGVIQCASGSSAIVAKLAARGIASSTAEGGAGAADTFNVFYTGTAVSSKAYQVLARLEFNSGQATAGTWATAPDRVEVFGPNFWLPGDVVDTQFYVNTGFGSYSTTIPLDDTVPQNTEGTQHGFMDISQKTAASRIEGHVVANVNIATTSAIGIVSVFRDSVANAIAATTIAQIPTTNGFGGSALTFRDFTNASGAHTYYVRLGANSGNIAGGGTNASRLFGGVNNAVSIELREIMA